MLDEVTSDTFRDSDFQSVFDLRSETSRQISRFIYFVSIDACDGNIRSSFCNIKDSKSAKKVNIDVCCCSFHSSTEEPTSITNT